MHTCGEVVHDASSAEKSIEMAKEKKGYDPQASCIILPPSRFSVVSCVVAVFLLLRS